MNPYFRRKRSSELFELYDNETIYSRPKRYVEEPKFDVFLNPLKREKQEETLKNLTKKFQNVFSSMDMKGSYPALFEVTRFKNLLILNKGEGFKPSTFSQKMDFPITG